MNPTNFLEATINTRKLVDAVGGVKELSRLLGERGKPTSTKTIYKWVERGTLTGIRLAEVLLVAQALKVEVNIYDFIADQSALDAYAEIQSKQRAETRATDAAALAETRATAKKTRDDAKAKKDLIREGKLKKLADKKAKDKAKKEAAEKKAADKKAKLAAKKDKPSRAAKPAKKKAVKKVAKKAVKKPAAKKKATVKKSAPKNKPSTKKKKVEKAAPVLDITQPAE